MRRWLGWIVLAGVLAAAAGPADARPRTTASQTIGDSDGDGRLESRAGESHVLRGELGTKTLSAAPVPLLFFGQLTDTHVVDEESPLRVEFTDKFGSVFTSAYRPNEGLSAQVLEQMTEQMRGAVSPVSGRSVDLVMTTGDNTDNTQCNETRWMIDLLDGGVVDPDSGLREGETAPTRAELCLRREEDDLAVPLTSCQSGSGVLYDGVRGGGEYYEPDRSGPEGPASEDGTGYSPSRQENQAENGRAAVVRDFPGLFERMNEPFNARGLGSIPWYGIFGNHDGLIQGNQPRNPFFESLAISCTKVLRVPTAGLETMDTQAEAEQEFARVLAEMRDVAQSGDPGMTRVVPADPRRRPLRKREYIEEHFHTGGAPEGHGFRRGADQGNYAFNPRPGVRFIVLDSIAEHGLEDGNIDDEQFRWLHAELAAADGLKELAVVFAHHSLRTMGQPPASPFVIGDAGGNLSPVVHFGEGPRESRIVMPCALTSPTAEPTPDETLRCLLLRHPSAIAFVNGHEHANRITPYPRVAGVPGAGGFWEINTASHIDWPQQSRVLDLVDNGDGSVSIVSTILDHAAPPENSTGDPVRRLASISRELSYNDPHASVGNQSGNGGKRGSPQDRNAELVVDHPWK